MCWLVLCLPGVVVASSRPPVLVTWLAHDLPAAQPPANLAGMPVPMHQGLSQFTLPYRSQGSWVRVEVLALPAQPVLALETPMASTVTLLLPDGSRAARSKLRPQDHSSSLSLVFALPATLKRGDVVWLHVADTVRAPVTLMVMERAEWEQRDRRRLIRTAVLSALLAALAMIASCYWLTLRERMFGYYTLHVLSLLLFIAASIGYLYTWPGGAWFATLGLQGQWALGAFAIALAVAFARHFLSIGRERPRLAPVFDLLSKGIGAAGVLVLVSPFQWPWFGAALALLLLGVNVFLLAAAVDGARRGNRYAWYFLGGWLPLTLSTTLRALQGLGVAVPPDVSLFYGLGVLCEAFMLSLGLADQVLAVRRERDLALQAAAQAAQLEAQNETLKENVRLREQVERMGRHDLKTPLASIVSIPRLVQELGPLLPEQQRLLRHVERAGYRALNMVNLSLDLLKMEQGRYAWQPAAVDLGVVLQRVLADLSTLGAAHQVQVQVRPLEHGRPVAWADELLCYSILANLVKNAVEAAPGGSVVRIGFDIAQPGWIDLRVHNIGTVPPEVRERFFEKYSTHGKPEGTGFGTYSAQLMARMQQGDVRLHSSEAEGTTLILRLRCAPEAPVEFACSEAGGLDIAPALPSQPSPLHVLLVDDDEYNLLFLSRRFAGREYQVRTASHGREALQMLAESAADLVILDLEMPGPSGFEVVRALRQHERLSGEAPAFVVALSSHDDVGTERRALEEGFDRYLRKPITPAALHQLVLDCQPEHRRAAQPT